MEEEIYFIGKPGSYSYEFIERLLKKQFPEFKKFKSIGKTGKEGFAKIKNAFLKNKNGIGILPIKNYTAAKGTDEERREVHKSIKEIRESRDLIAIIGWGNLNIILNLIVPEKVKKENISSLKTIYSKNVVKPQCLKYLKANNLNKKFENSTSTTAGRQNVLKDLEKDKITGCIGSNIAIPKGLKVIQENINDEKINPTKFLIVVHKNSPLALKKPIIVVDKKLEQELSKKRELAKDIEETLKLDDKDLEKFIQLQLGNKLGGKCI